MPLNYPTSPSPRSLRAFRRLAFIAVALALGVALPPAAPAQDEGIRITRRNEPVTGHGEANAPMACDVNDDGVADLVITDSDGQLIAYDLRNQALYRQTKFSTPLSAPVMGDFLGNSTFDIAVLTPGGEVIIVDGTKLEEIVRHQAAGPAQALIPPAAFPIKKDGRVVSDGLLIVDDAGLLSAWSYASGAPEKLWEKAIGPVSRPPTVAYITSFAVPDIAVGTKTGDVHVINTEDHTRALTLPYADSGGIATIIAARNLDDRAGFDELYAMTASGRLIGLRFNRSANRMDEIFPPAEVFPPGEALRDPVIVTYRETGVSSEDIYRIILASSRRVVSYTPDGRRDLDKEFIPDGAIVTKIAYLESRTAGPTITFADDTGQIYFLNPRYLANPVRQSVKAISGNADSKDPEQFIQTPLIFDARGSNSASFLFLTAQTKKAVYFESAVPLSANQILWQTINGNSHHTGTYSAAFFDDLNERKKSLQARKQSLMEQARLAANEERWSDVVAAMDVVLELDPANAEATAIRRDAWIKGNMLLLVIGGGALAIALLVLALVSIRMARLARLRKRAAQAAAIGNWDDAIEALAALQALRPQEDGIRVALARALIEKKDYREENIPIFEEMLRREPDNADYINALASCYLKQDVLEDKALAVYERALAAWKDKAPLLRQLGRLRLRRQDWDDAAKNLKEAIRAGMQDPATYALLADCYVRMKFHSSKALPVYQRVAGQKTGDPDFHEAYALALMDAKQMDAEAETACKALLVLRPGHGAASLYLAQICFQRGAHAEAAAIARRALKESPDDAQALHLLSQCLLFEGRTDAEALDFYTKALAHHPDDKEILTILAHHYFHHDAFDDRTISIYQRAYAANPRDAHILRAMARVARDAGDHARAIEVMESLIELGHGSPELYTQLAAAYAQTGVIEPKTEKAFRVALSEDPQNATFLRCLAGVMVTANKTDAEAIKVMEARLKTLGADEAVGTQLAKAYMENNRFENAIALTQTLSQKYPANAEIRRIQALASLHGDQLDQAIQQYTALLKQHPGDTEALVNLAMAFSFKGRLDDEAAHLYVSALKADPRNEHLRLTLARVLASRGQMPQAIQELKNVLGASPDSAGRVRDDILRLLAEYPESAALRWFFVEILIKTNHLRDAIEQMGVLFEANPANAPQIIKTLEFILKKDPQNLPAFVQMGLLLRLGDNLDRARAVLERAFEIRPDSPDVQKQLAEVYEKTLAKGDNMEVRYHLGKIYYLMNLFDKAIGCFQKTEQDFRWENDSLKMLGKCFLAKNMLDLAFQSYQKAQVDDELKFLLYDIAQRYEHEGDIVGAKQVYKVIFASDINYRDVREKFEMLSGTTSEPVSAERTSLMNELSESARRRYELLDELGRGAMGIVYRAKDIELDEVVALKILPDNLSNNPEAVRRFKSEARSARRLAHPNIIRIHDIGEELGRKYISMEFVEGTDLKKVIRKHKKLDERTVAELARQIADALGYAHTQGIIHRDIKPANIMLTKNSQVKVADYGIAKLVESTDATMAGAVLGTPLYMSPEQVKGEPVDARADIYSLGVLLYELLSGKPPFFEGDLAYQHIHKAPLPLEGVEPGLATIVMQCLAKDRDQRPRDGQTLCQMLTRLTRQYAQTQTG